MEPDRVVLVAEAPGPVLVRVRYAGWAVPTGNACVLPTEAGWTQVNVEEAGSVVLVPALRGRDRCPAVASQH
jgi:hypothetical protein